MRASRSKVAIAATLLIGAAGCELVAGLEDHQLVAANSSDASSDSASNEASSAPAFTIADVPALTLQQGLSSVVNITITRENGFADAVNITVSGLPAGATTTPLLMTSETSTGALTIALDPTTPQSLSHLSIDGATSDGRTSASAKMDLIVRGPPGSLDLLYGNQGSFDSTMLSEDGAALDANDNLVVVGQNGTGGFGALRLLSDGTVDSTFGGGFVSQAFAPMPDFFDAVFPLASGQILFAGALNELSPPSGTEYVRLSATGAFDKTYSADGGLGYESNTAPGQTRNYAVDPTGRVLGIGTISVSATFELYVERRTVSGALDATFQNGALSIGSGDVSGCSGALQSTAKLVVLCEGSGAAGTGLALVRFTTNGAVDSTFGGGGYVNPASNTLTPHGVSQILVQADDKILALGNATTTTLLARYSGTDGSFDLPFGFNGVAASLPVDMSTMAMQSDGKIILAGYAQLTGDAGTYSVFQVERLTSSGAPDPTFGNGGIVQNVFGSPQAGGSQATRVLVQKDGRIVVVGQTLLSVDSSELTVARYWP